jgi:hypothetical protein
MDFYKVLIVGSSGKGKTYSARNMDRENTFYINVENKPLPFKGGFTNHVKPKTLKEVTDAIISAGTDEKITSIYLDSFSAVFDMILLDCRKRFKGFDVWNNYSDAICTFIDLIKRVPKNVYITAHYEILNIEGASEKRARVKGKELEGLIEKEFTLVVYAESKMNDAKKPEYYFSLFSEGTSAKCPPDIFGEDIFTIPNDCKFMNDKITEFISQ